jgi:hypothetical protein
MLSTQCVYHHQTKTKTKHKKDQRIHVYCEKKQYEFAQCFPLLFSPSKFCHLILFYFIFLEYWIYLGFHLVVFFVNLYGFLQCCKKNPILFSILALKLLKILIIYSLFSIFFSFHFGEEIYFIYVLLHV